MHLIPRDYQIDANQAVFDYFKTHLNGNPLIAMPTGTGKSVVIAMFLYSLSCLYPLARVLILTHVKELIEQNHDKLVKAWPTAPAGIYSAGLKRRDTSQKYIFGGIASVNKRAHEFGEIAFVLVDEAHLVSDSDATMYRTFVEELRKASPWVRVIGLTATPWRLGLGHLTDGGGLFTDVCFDITGLNAFNKLLADGYLSPLVPKPTTTTLEIDGVHMRGGEFVAGELQDAVDKRSITQAALKETLTLAKDRSHWLFFCSGVAHCEHVAEMLNEMGVECMAVHGKTENRERILNRFKNGTLKAVTTNNVLTTGYDHPELDLIVVLRPTASPVLWVQMLGRGTRPVYAKGYDITTKEGRLAAMLSGPKQDCLVLDFARNSERLGPINDPVLPKKKGEKMGEAPIKICPACNTYNHASVTMCCYCGHEFPRSGVPKVFAEASTMDLIKADMPVVQILGVDHVTYSSHYKHGKGTSLKVTYFCGARMLMDFVLLEYDEPFHKRNSAAWWSARTPPKPQSLALGAYWRDTPTTVDDALQRTGELKAPSHLRVWTNKHPYPQIMGYCYDGSAFGSELPGAHPIPSAAVTHSSTRAAPAPPPLPADATRIPRKPLAGFDDLDDDIPF